MLDTSERQESPVYQSALFFSSKAQPFAFLLTHEKRLPLRSFMILGLNGHLGVIPLSSETVAGDHVLISGVELRFMSVPLHKVFYKSDLVSGYVTVKKLSLCLQYTKSDA